LLALPGSFGGGWLRSPADAWGPVAVSGAVALSAFVIIEFYFIYFIVCSTKHFDFFIDF
jgi:hypothetical protein